MSIVEVYLWNKIGHNYKIAVMYKNIDIMDQAVCFKQRHYIPTLR